jgi:hypothetical protein
MSFEKGWDTGGGAGSHEADEFRERKGGGGEEI